MEKRVAILATKPEFLVAKDEMLVALATDYRSQFQALFRNPFIVYSECLTSINIIVMHEYLPISDTIRNFRATSST